MTKLDGGQLAANVPVANVHLNADGSGTATITGPGDIGSPAAEFNFQQIDATTFRELESSRFFPTQPYATVTTALPGQDPSLVYDSPDAALYLSEPNGAATYEVITDEPPIVGSTITFTAAQQDYRGFPACYLEGTRILSAQGALAIESLRVGDLLPTHDGGLVPVTWTGSRTLHSADFPEYNLVDFWPILIRRNAFGPSTPSRDLYVSPCHRMYLDGFLIPAWRLIDERHIIRARWLTTVRYWHVAGPRHSIIRAENALSETFLQSTGNHLAFDNGLAFPAACHGGEQAAPELTDNVKIRSLLESATGKTLISA